MMTTQKLVRRMIACRLELMSLKEDCELPLLLSSSPCLAGELEQAVDNLRYALRDAVDVLADDAAAVEEGGAL